MSNELKGSVAVVAGGARGIGRACALRFAELSLAWKRRRRQR
jgi:NAD(P)-dependent dehydrogenase (short-subunit alcohol dehydrogenase family)